MIGTIDVAGVRALHDRLGARAAGKLLTRCTRDKPTNAAMEELRGCGASLSEWRGHGTMWTALDATGKTRLNGPRLSMRGTWPHVPEVMQGALVGQHVTRLFEHAHLDEDMLIESVHVDDDDAELTLSGTARPLREVLDRLRDGLRP